MLEPQHDQHVIAWMADRAIAEIIRQIADREARGLRIDGTQPGTLMTGVRNATLVTLGCAVGALGLWHLLS